MGKKAGEVQPTAEERELASIAQSMQADFDQTWKPIRNKAIADIKDAEPERKQALGIANAENQAAFAAARPKAEKALTLSGARPGSARFALESAKLSDAQGMSNATGKVDASQSIDNAKTTGMLSLAEMGRGEQGRAIAGLSDAADASARKAYGDAQQSLADAQGLQSAIGLAAGIGAGAMGSGGLSPEELQIQQTLGHPSLNTPIG